MKNPEASWRLHCIFQCYYEQKSIDKTTQMFHRAKEFCEGKQWGKWNMRPLLHSCVRISRAYFIDVIKYKEYHFSDRTAELDKHRSKETIEKAFPIPQKLNNNDINWDQKWLEWNNYIHKKKWLNSAKRAAFNVKWIMNVRPIISEYISNDTDDLPSENDQRDYYRINAEFAYSYIIYDCIGKIWYSCPQDIKEKFYLDFIYHLQYRPIDERSFFLIFDNLIEICLAYEKMQKA